MSIDFGTIIAKLNQASNFILSEINWGVILEVKKLKHFKDLHDRVIVATANIFDAPLITRDQKIKEIYRKVIW